jgi:hypothetical protein
LNFGRRRNRVVPPAIADSEPIAPLGIARVVTGSRFPEQPSQRRHVNFQNVARLYVPSLLLDYSLLFLRQAGARGEELFLVWAGTLFGSTAVVSSVVVPKAASGALHGEIPPDIAGRVFESLDSRDLVALAQVHSHPARAFLSHIDEERPLFALRGFLSIIVPDFGFVDIDALSDWGVYEYQAKRSWREFNTEEKRDLLVADDSLILVT